MYVYTRDGKATLDNGGKDIKEMKARESVKEREEGKRTEMMMRCTKR
jgi:hypothetical protein